MDPATAATMFKIGTDFVGGGIASGEDRRERERERAQQMQMFLANLNQRRSEQGDDRGRSAWQMAEGRSRLPGMDRAETYLNARFAAGPGSFRDGPERTDALRSATANYQPGQNPNIQQLGADWNMLYDRFAATPGPAPDPAQQQRAAMEWFGSSGQRIPSDIGRQGPAAIEAYIMQQYAQSQMGSGGQS